MDPLELTYDNLTDVPESFRGLYEEQDGKAVLAKINGLKTQQDIDRVQEGLRKEREDHKKLQALYKPFKNLNAEEIQEKLDRIDELEAASGDKLDDDSINKIVEGRLKQRVAPLERKIEELSSTNQELSESNEKLTGTITTTDRNAAVRRIASEMKVHGTALSDVELVAANYLEKDEHTGQWIVRSDAEGVTPGADVKQFMKEMQKARPHWWPASAGGGANGGSDLGQGEANPFSGKSWNVTQQGALLRSDRATAEALAKAAGTSIGGPRPQTP